jgi:hypothetical protein
LVVVPQARPEQASAGDSGKQHEFETQTSPALQDPQGMDSPHVVMSVSQTVVPHALASTPQHVPSA